MPHLAGPYNQPTSMQGLPSAPYTYGASTGAPMPPPHHTPAPTPDLASLLMHLEQVRREERREEREERREEMAALLARLTPVPPTPPAPQPPTDPDPPPPEIRPKPDSKFLQPPTLQPDATLKSFQEWRAQWDDFVAFYDVGRTFPHAKQLIQLRACLGPQINQLLVHSLRIPPTTTMTVQQILDALQSHFRSLQNEVIQRRDLMSCRQAEGETFQAFYTRLRRLADDVGRCPGDPEKCHESWVKAILTLGLRDEELVRRVTELPNGSSLKEARAVCVSYEASATTTSAIRSQGSQAGAVSTYKKDRQQRGRQKRQAGSDQQPPTNQPPCQTCPNTHEPNKCPAVDGTCTNCGNRGHAYRAPTCPARSVQCRACLRYGHFQDYCRKPRGSAPPQAPPPYTPSVQAAPPPPQPNSAIRSIHSGSTSTAPPVQVSLHHSHGSSSLVMKPDTGADETVIGKAHLAELGIPLASLDPVTGIVVENADGSPMSPPLGTFTTTLTLHGRSIEATIGVQDSLPTPLLSYDHCLGLAIIPPKFPRPIKTVTYARSCSTLALPPISSAEEARAYFLETFGDVLVSKEDLRSAPLRPMEGPPMRIHLQEGAEPFAIHNPRPVAFPLQQAVQEELASMEAQGIITPAAEAPSEWCHPMVVVPKDKGVRITVDMSNLNRQVRRPTHPSPTPYDAVRRVDARSRYFTTADALCGYWQMTLAEEDQHLTTFITPYGRFRYCRGPMGFAATGDAFCLRGDRALQGITQCVKVVDDILLYDEDFTQHLERVHAVLTRCRTHGITLNRDKFVVAASSVRFCGFHLSQAGIEADEEKVKAIRDFPTPSNITDLRSFMGLVNQLSEFTPDIATTAKDLRPLLSTKRTFTWSPDHDVAFRRTKDALTSPPVLANYDPTKPVTLQTDASRLNGLGYALLQDHGQSGPRLIQCGSRFLTDCESRYSTIELEMLAVVWASAKCRMYLLGLQHYTVMTDHRPLIPILNSYTLDAVENPRLQRMKEKLSQYIFTAIWRAGKFMCIPDALSRSPVTNPTPEDERLCATAASSLRRVVRLNSVVTSPKTPSMDDDRTLRSLADAARADEEYVRLRQYVTEGFPANRLALHESALPYWKLRDHLSADGDLVLYGARVVVPRALRRQTLARLHDSHKGVEATKRRARLSVFWPGLDSDIATTVRACEPCQVLQPSQQQEPYRNDDSPTRPFESVSADFFHVAGRDFLVIADRLSGWPVVVPCTSDVTAHTLCRAICRYFRDVGVPVRLRSDGGPQFASADFQGCMARWGVDHITSSPRHPQSNGHAEAAVKAVKYLILKTAPNGNIDVEDFDRGLLELRNSPNHTGRSPAQVLFGHNLRSCVPAHHTSFLPEWQDRADACDRRAAAHDAVVLETYDRHARPLPELHLGQRVRVQDPGSLRWDKVGVVMGRGTTDTRGEDDRSYFIRLPSGRVWWRNRRYLRPAPTSSEAPPDRPGAASPQPAPPAPSEEPPPSHPAIRPSPEPFTTP